MSISRCVVLQRVLFIIGGVGFLVRRNVLVSLMSIEVMLNAVNLALVAFNRAHARHEPTDGQMFAFFVIAGGGGRGRRRARHRAVALPPQAHRPLGRGGPPEELKRSEAPRRTTHMDSLFPRDDFSLIAVILALPLLGAFVNGVWGSRLGKAGRAADGARRGRRELRRLASSTFLALRSTSRHEQGEHVKLVVDGVGLDAHDTAAAASTTSRSTSSSASTR